MHTKFEACIEEFKDTARLAYTGIHRSPVINLTANRTRYSYLCDALSKLVFTVALVLVGRVT
jgi:hypothetical protein